MRLILSVIVMAKVAVLAVAAQTPRQSVDITTPDGIVLKGTYVSPGKPGPGILLFHQCTMDRRAWDRLTPDLVSAGFHVLAFDSRGFGETRGDRSAPPAVVMADAELAYGYLLSQPGVDRTRVAAGGASCGVTTATDLAAKHAEVKALVLLSGEVSIGGMSYIRSNASLAIFGAAGQGEPFDAATIRNIVGASKNPRSILKLYAGSEHGVPLFEKNADLKPALVKWLQTQLQ